MHTVQNSELAPSELQTDSAASCTARKEQYMATANLITLEFSLALLHCSFMPQGLGHLLQGLSCPSLWERELEKELHPNS